jgi:stage IV sporulation protein FB
MSRSSRAAPRSRWSFSLGSLFGIPIRIHASLVLLVLWLLSWAVASGQDVGLWVGVLALAFGSVIAHELGHAFAASGYGVETREIVVHPIGGLARFERAPKGIAELVIALAGPAVNLMLTFFFFSLVVAFGAPLQLELDAPPAHVLMTAMLNINFLLFAVNMIPAFPLDGGRALRAFLSLAVSQERATRYATTLTQALAFLFAIMALLGGFVDPGLRLLVLAMAFIVLTGANRELLVQRTREQVQAFTASDGMMTRVETLEPQQALEWAARLSLATHQRDFPVVDAWGRVAGMLERSNLFAGLEQRGKDTAVLEVMDRDVLAVEAGVSLEEVLDALGGRHSVAVVLNGEEKFLGMITLEKIGQLIEVTRRV